MSQRADFFEEIASVDTLFKRPVFNTRDEPHGDHAQWLRLHVICGDANMHVPTTARKVALVKMALHLALAQVAPSWRLSDPVRAFAEVSRSIDGEGRIELEGGSWTTPRLILESYLDDARMLLEDCEEPWAIELCEIGEECRQLLELRFDEPEVFSRNVEWAAKLSVLDTFAESEGKGWNEEAMRSLDLAYSLLDLDEGLYPALADGGFIAGDPEPQVVAARERQVFEGTRAYARGLAVAKFRQHLVGVSWGGLVFKLGDDYCEVQLDPGKTYPEDLGAIDDVRAFVDRLEAIQNDPS
jgi:proteasome accessory factor A